MSDHSRHPTEQSTKPTKPTKHPPVQLDDNLEFSEMLLLNLLMRNPPTEGPSVTHYFDTCYQSVIGLGKDTYATITIFGDGLEYLGMSKETE